MEFFTSDQATLGFRNIHPLLAELIHTIPDIIDPNQLSDIAESRLFPIPTREDSLDDIRSDWKAFVEPGLQEHFQSVRAIVLADLRSLEGDGEHFTLRIPLHHAEAWLNVLNQARLVLASELGFDQATLEASDSLPDLLSEKGLLVFRINLYAFMQQCLIDQIE